MILIKRIFQILLNLINYLKNHMKKIQLIKEYTNPPKEHEKVFQTFCGT